jgi:hypothetical protein
MLGDKADEIAEKCLSVTGRLVLAADVDFVALPAIMNALRDACAKCAAEVRCDSEAKSKRF